jgi:hypothetical protein
LVNSGAERTDQPERGRVRAPSLGAVARPVIVSFGCYPVMRIQAHERTRIIAAAYRALAVMLMTHAAFTLLALIFVVPHRLGPLNGTSILRVGTILAIECVVAAGLFSLRRWAAVVAAAVLLIVGGSMIVGSAASVPLPWVALNFALAGLLLTPALLLVVGWRSLP